MTGDRDDDHVRRAIGGDATAATWILDAAASSADPTVLVMAALLAGDADALDRARAIATTSRDRQLIEIARAHLGGRFELVDALARDHLVDHPASLVVAWIASGAAADRSTGGGRRDS